MDDKKKRRGKRLSEAEILVNMPRSLKDRLKKEAHQRQIGVSALIRMALLEWLESH